MLRHVVAALTACVFLAALPACGSSTDDETPTVEAQIGAARPFVLLPGAPGVANLCATELATTYCSQRAATAAAASCEARLDPATTSACAPGSCAPTYAADRPSCHAGTTYPSVAACDEPVLDDCSFYRSCLEASHPCGESGYALVYGERLCYAFLEKRGEFSSEGKQWLRGIRACLQRSLVPLLHEPATCTAVLDKAYATHPDCYTALDSSICSLPPSDVLALASILGNDLFSERALAQMRQVARTCLRRLFVVGAGFARDTARHTFFRQLEEASQSEPTMRAFVAGR